VRSSPFSELQRHLLERGVAANQARRITGELGDHLHDLRNEGQQNGLSTSEAERFAMTQLGDPKIIAEKILERTELKTWVYRYPRVARFYLPFAYALLLPATPVIAGIRNPAIVVRWIAALMLSGAVTAALFLFMQISIDLS
jgi:hypothetical protein